MTIAADEAFIRLSFAKVRAYNAYLERLSNNAYRTLTRTS